MTRSQDEGERFVILDRLGSGGMGRVYRARDRQLDRLVALKFIAVEGIADEVGRERLLAEARIAASFKHPGVAGVIDVTRVDGHWCVVTELVDGETLESRIARGPIPAHQALDLTIELADTLRAVHARGYVHGDVKPSNVLLRGDGRTTLVDFGLARTGFGSPEGDAEPGGSGFTGTPGYSAPERVRGAPLDPRSDVYALGVVLYEALSGRRPFEGSAPLPILRHVVQNEAPPLPASTQVPLVVESVVRRALARDAGQRYASMDALHRALCGARGAVGWAASTDATVPGGARAEAAAFRGLLPFQEADRDSFFGREEDVRTLLQKITREDFRFGVLYGDSGSGKTSLLRAGLVPRLWELGDLALYCRPFDDPVASLLEECGRRSRVCRTPGESALDHVRRVAAREPGRTFILWDPLEEFFVSVREPAMRESFLTFLAALHGRKNVGIRCLVSIRSDFLHLVGSELAGRIPEPLAMTGLQHLSHLDEQLAREVIERSAKRAGLELEPALVRTLGRDLASDGSVLPSELQIVGQRLESRRIHTLDDYRRAGGREALVFGFVDDVVRASGEARAAGLVLASLISDEDTRLTLAAGEIARRSQLPSRTVERLLGLFVQARIVRELREEEPWRYELMHEYLIGKVNQVAGRVMDATQRANRLLRQYASTHAADTRALIPLRHVWLIRRHADASSRPVEQSLLARSLRLGLAKAALMALGLGTAATLAAAALSVRQEWDERRLRDGHATAVRRVVFSPDGTRLVSGGEDGKVVLWDFAGRQRIATLGDLDGWVRAVAFSPDGALVAAQGADGSVRIWNTLTLGRVAVLRGPEVGYSALAFSPDGRYLAAGGDERTLLWNAPDWKLERELPRAGAGLVFSDSDPPTLYGSARWAMTLGRPWTWAIAPGADEGQQRMAGGNAIALSRDGRRLAVIDGSGDVYFTNPLGGRPARRFRAHRDHGRSVAFSPDGRFFASAAEDVVLWDARTESRLSRLEGTSGVWSVDFSPDGRWLVAGHMDGDIVIWDVPERERLASLAEHHASVRSVAFSRDARRLASASNDRSLVLWDGESGDKQAVLVGHTGRVHAVAWLPDGSGVAACDFDGAVVLWDVVSRKPRWSARTRSNEPAACYALAVSPDGRLVASSVGLFDAEGGRERLDRRSLTNWGKAYGLAFSPDGSRLVSGTDRGALVLYDSAHWSPQALQRDPETSFVTVGFSPDGRLVVTGDDDGGVKLWNGESLRPVKVLGRVSARLKSVVFSPDGRFVASAGDDQTISLWDVARGTLVTTIGSHRAPQLSLAFSPDGRRLASGGQDRSVRLFTRHRALWGRRLD